MPDKKTKTILEGVVGAAAVGFTIIFSPILRSRYKRWGAMEAELKRPFPGDEFVPLPKSELTCAITIHASPEKVWPWFAQLGCQRGGWYSYDLLDNGGRPSANQILPEHQHLEVGDVVKAVPNGSFGFPVAAIDPERALVLAGTLDTRTGQPADPNQPGQEAYFSGDQTFVIEDLGNDSSRLLFRMRTDWDPSWLNGLIYRGILEPASFVMGRKMLINIKQRAERLAART